jgi:uncharacterized membrane protein YoaK (UPF0700 family)
LDQSKNEAPAISSNTRDFLFVVLTCVAGSIDALSVFGLGGVFTSLLSGNTIVLAAYLLQGHPTRALLGIFVFVGYLPGEVLATYLLRKEKRKTLEWTKRVTKTLGIEAIPLLALVVGTYLNHDYSLNIGLATLVFLAAFSMGIQYRCAKQVNTSVITTMITGTLSSLVSRLVDRGEPPSSDLKNSSSTTGPLHVKHVFRRPSETTVFLASVWGAYFVGAASSAAVLIVSRTAAAAIPLVLILIVVAYAGIKQGKERGVDR